MYKVTTDEQSQQQIEAIPADKGDLVYLVLEDQRRVDILVVLWLA